MTAGAGQRPGRRLPREALMSAVVDTALDAIISLKDDEATRQIPVVALSASAMPHEVQEALSAGALDYWTKPIDFPQFLEGLRHLLSRPRADSELESFSSVPERHAKTGQI